MKEEYRTTFEPVDRHFMNLRGPAADRPPSSAIREGRLYVEIDSPYRIWRDNGTSWDKIGYAQGSLGVQIMRDAAAAKPASDLDMVGRLYVETDSPYKVWRDNGAGWDLIGYAANALPEVRNSAVFLAQNPASTTAGIQEAIDDAFAAGGGIVFIPPGIHGITTVIYLRLNVSVLGSGLASEIRPAGGHQVFDEQWADIRNWSVRNLWINFGPATGNVPSADPLDCAFYFNSPRNIHHFRIENVQVDYGYCGYYDLSGAWMGTLSNVWTNYCTHGFWKENGGTFHFENCYTQGAGEAGGLGETAWYLKNTGNNVLTACAMGSCYANICAQFEGCHDCKLDGFSAEHNVTGTDDGKIVYLKTCVGICVDSLQSSLNTVHTVAGKNGYVLHVDNCWGNIRGFKAGGNCNDKHDGDGVDVYTCAISGASYMMFTGCRMKTLTTLPGSVITGKRYALASLATAGSQIVETACELLWDGTGTEGLRLDSNDTMSRLAEAFLVRRLTTVQRNALTPANGMLIYNTTTNAMEAYENGAWVDL